MLRIYYRDKWIGGVDEGGVDRQFFKEKRSLGVIPTLISSSHVKTLYLKHEY
jgi:hypothetical protein